MSVKAKNTGKALAAAFEHGEIELKGQFMLGSNYTFLVTVKHAGREFQAVYKPMRGEQPLWDFPEASLAGRGVAIDAMLEADAVRLRALRARATPFAALSRRNGELIRSWDDRAFDPQAIAREIPFD